MISTIDDSSNRILHHIKCLNERIAALDDKLRTFTINPQYVKKMSESDVEKNMNNEITKILIDPPYRLETHFRINGESEYKTVIFNVNYTGYDFAQYNASTNGLYYIVIVNGYCTNIRDISTGYDISYNDFKMINVNKTVIKQYEKSLTLIADHSYYSFSTVVDKGTPFEYLAVYPHEYVPVIGHTFCFLTGNGIYNTLTIKNIIKMTSFTDASNSHHVFVFCDVDTFILLYIQNIGLFTFTLLNRSCDISNFENYNLDEIAQFLIKNTSYNYSVINNYNIYDNYISFA